jgi:hypothetical protein
MVFVIGLLVLRLGLGLTIAIGGRKTVLLWLKHDTPAASPTSPGIRTPTARCYTRVP